MGHSDSDLRRIEELIAIMKKNDLVEIEVEHEDDKIHLRRAEPRVVARGAGDVVASGGEEAGPEALARNTESQAADGLVEIKSPLVGTFYAKPSPDSEECVELNSQVTSQTVVCIIEAMKVMNEIKAETTGTIVEILVENGQAVEYGQVLFKVKPD